MRELANGPFALQQLNGRMAAVLATTAVFAAAALLSGAASAQDAVGFIGARIVINGGRASFTNSAILTSNDASAAGSEAAVGER